MKGILNSLTKWEAIMVSLLSENKARIKELEEVLDRTITRIKELEEEISIKQNENYKLRQKIGYFEEVIGEVVRGEYTNFESMDKLKKLIEEKRGRSVADKPG